MEKELNKLSKKEFEKEKQEMLDFLQDLKEERIKGIKTGFYVPLVEKGWGFYTAINGEKDYEFELNGEYYRKTREGNEHDLKEVEKRKNIEKLFESIENNDLRQVKEYLAQGIDVNFKDNIRDGYTPLMSSSYHGRLNIAKYLIEQGADVNIKCKGDTKGLTALMETCKLSCNTKTAELLIEKGADVNAKDKNGKTALDYIVMSEQIQSGTGQDFKEIKDFVVSKGGKLGSQVAVKNNQKTKTKQKSNDFERGI